uniref:UHRF1-binding protein 1-like n=1 Tax=Saccoglossus kowalevskii TaxID=10224 RepID=A0ABM0M876_SACKO|nr:PREDICTED: UHRF1-binding protein 1-like [Saccoglossus kowalevskii]
MESCVVVRLDDFSISAVTTEESANSNKKFLSSDNEAFSLPPEMSSLHVEYTSYYFLDGLEYPVPQPNIYVKLNPIKLEMDYMTVLWINLFANHMASGVQMKPDGGESDILSELYHNDIRIDALMPRITIPAEKMVPDQPDRPNALQIQFSQVILSNCRIATEASRSDLASAIQNLYGGTLFTDQQQYPNEKSDLTAVSQMLWNHAYKTGESEGTKHCTSSPVAVQGKGNIASVGTNEKIKNQPISKMSFFTQASEDVWCAHLDQVWMDFLGVESAKGRPVPLVEAVPISIWACLPKESQSYKAKLLPKNKIPEVSSVKDDSIVKLNGEISHQNKRLLYGHRKAESVSYPIFGTTSPASTPTSDNISMSMSDLTMKDTSIKGALSDSSLQSSNTSGIGTMDSGGSTISSLRTMLGSSESMSSTATTDSAFSSVSTSNSRIQANQQSFTSGESVDTCDNDVADTNLLVEVKGKIRVMINHPQIMFLLRLIDSFQALTDSIEEDIVMFHGKSETVSSVVVAARLHSAEVLLNLPPIAESKGDKNNGMNAEVKCPGIDACGADVTTDADCVNRQSDIQDSVMNSDISSRINVNEEQAMNANTKAVDVTDYTKIKPAVLIVDSSIDPLENGDVASDYELLSLDIQHGVRFGVKKDEVVNTEGERTLQQEVLRNTHNSDVQSYGAMNAVAEFDDTDDFGEFQQADINRRNDFKEQELLKTAPECALPMNSLANLVNKDEIVVSGEMNTMEDNLKCTSSTKDCCDNTESSEVTKTEKEDLAKLVSIIKVKLSDLQLGVQLFGDNSGLKTVLGDVELQENGNKNYTEFVDQWVADNNRMKDEQLPPLAKSENPAISLRLSLGSCAEKYCPGTSIKKHVGLKVNGLNTQLLMSTLTSLVDLVEDEKKGDNDDEMPIDIEITQACIKLKTPILK